MDRPISHTDNQQTPITAIAPTEADRHMLRVARGRGFDREPFARTIVLLPNDDRQEPEDDGVNRAPNRDDETRDPIVFPLKRVRGNAMQHVLATYGKSGKEHDDERKQ